jgi:hypothetical protein
LRPEVIFRIERKTIIRRAFDATIRRGAGVKLFCRYRLLWAIGPKQGFFLGSKLDAEALGKTRKAEKCKPEEITDIEFCCFELAGVIPSQPS